jgi:hypothetical protein
MNNSLQLIKGQGPSDPPFPCPKGSILNKMDVCTKSYISYRPAIRQSHKVLVDLDPDLKLFFQKLVLLLNKNEEPRGSINLLAKTFRMISLEDMLQKPL